MFISHLHKQTLKRILGVHVGITHKLQGLRQKSGNLN